MLKTTNKPGFVVRMGRRNLFDFTMDVISGDFMGIYWQNNQQYDDTL